MSGNRQNQTFDLPAIRDRNDLADLAGRVVALKRKGNRHTGCCPFHSEKTPSFSVFGSGATAHYHCFGCGAHGDVIGFVMRADGVSFPEACRMLTAQGGLDDPKILEQARARAEWQRTEQAKQEALNREVQRQRSRRLWGETERVTIQKPALRYFAARGIEISRLPGGRLPDDVRYHPQLEYWWTAERTDENPTPKPIALTIAPALVSAIRGPAGRGVGVEIKYLDFVSGQKATIVDPETGEILTPKKMRGNPWGGSIHLAPPAPVMAFGEGMETCLSVMIAEPGLPVWACLSIGNLAGIGLGRGRRVATPGSSGAQRSNPQADSHPQKQFRFLPSTTPDLDKPAFLPPPACRSAILLEDADNADPDAADCQYSCAAARWKAAGHAVSRARPPAGLDFNDVLTGGARQNLTGEMAA